MTGRRLGGFLAILGATSVAGCQFTVAVAPVGRVQPKAPYPEGGPPITAAKSRWFGGDASPAGWEPPIEPTVPGNGVGRRTAPMFRRQPTAPAVFEPGSSQELPTPRQFGPAGGPGGEGGN